MKQDCFRSRIQIIVFFVIFLLECVSHFNVSAQQSLAASNGQTFPSITDTNSLVNGTSFSNAIQLQFSSNGSALSNWKLTVQAVTGNFVPGSSHPQTVYMPTSYWALKYGYTNNNGTTIDNSRIAATTTALSLATSEVTLINSSAYTDGFYYFAMYYTLVLSGSRQLLKLYNDGYSTVLRFRLYNNGTELRAQTDYTLNVNVYPPYGQIPQAVSQYTNSIALQNGASNVTLNFANTDALKQGVETTIADGLKVTSTDGKFQIVMQTNAANFTKSGVVSTLPVSSVKLVPSQGSSTSNAAYSTVSLSNNQQTIISNNSSAEGSFLYNLKYTTKLNTNQTAFINADFGTYETQITYTMNPL